MKTFPIHPNVKVVNNIETVLYLVLFNSFLRLLTQKDTNILKPVRVSKHKIRGV